MKQLKRLRFYFRLIWAFLQEHQKRIFFGLLGGGLAFYFLSKSNLLFPQRNSLQIGLVGKFTPNELPLEVQELISDGLTQIEADGSVMPNLAASWEAKERGRKYQFVLRDDLFWQDGTPVLASEIDYNFADVATVALDDKTVEFELKEPFSPFPSIVARPVFKKGLVGTGQYQVKSLQRQGQTVEKIVLRPLVKREKTLIYRFYPTQEAARTAFKLGELDQLKGITDLADLKPWPRIKITSETKKDRYVGIFFNTREGELAEKSVRQALAYAIKKRWEPRALNPIRPDSWAYNPGVKPYALDLENAKTLLEKAPAPETITLTADPALFGVAEEIGRDWQELGVETKVSAISTLAGNFQALLATQEIPADPDQYFFWHSTQPTNLTGYQEPKIDNLLEEARQILDQDERQDLYFDFQRFIVEDTPAIFLFHPTVYTLERK